MSSDQSKWAASYKKTLESPPEIGAILSTFSGTATKLTAELKQGFSPFIFARAHVPDLLNCPLGWHLRDVDDNSFHGWRCVLLPRARAEVIQKIGLGELNAEGTESTLAVKSLKVIRYSNSGNAILCEVHEYWTEETPEEVAKTPPDEEVDEVLNAPAAHIAIDVETDIVNDAETVEEVKISASEVAEHLHDF